MAKIVLLCILSVLAYSSAQRITTIHLDGVQYFISRMNPYSPELNYFLAYQYCRSLGLQLASFETKEKAESMTMYLKNAGYGNYDFWTSGNRLGTGMFLWMSTGLPFNATFDFFENSADAVQAGLLDPIDHNSNTSPQRTARDSSSGAEKGCVVLKQPALKWMPEDCSAVKDFICEQTRCYYYNYGSIPVSSAQGRPITSTTLRPAVAAVEMMNNYHHPSTTPLPIIMSTYASFVKKTNQPDSGESQPSFISLKLDHERALDAEEEETDHHEEQHASRHEDADADDEDQVANQDADNESYDEQHAHELNDDVKHNVLAAQSSDASVAASNKVHHDEVQAIEEVHQQLQDDTQEFDKDLSEDDTEAHEEDDAAAAAFSSIENNDAVAFSNKEDETQNKSVEKLSTSTEAPSVAPVEVRLKQISQEVEKMAVHDNHAHHHQLLHNNIPGPLGAIINHDTDEVGRQSFLSLTDLIRTLRPNDKQIIPQIDSDYSNAMRVLGESSSSAVVHNNNKKKNNDESQKFTEMDDGEVHQQNRALF